MVSNREQTKIQVIAALSPAQTAHQQPTRNTQLKPNMVCSGSRAGPDPRPAASVWWDARMLFGSCRILAWAGSRGGIFRIFLRLLCLAPHQRLLAPLSSGRASQEHATQLLLHCPSLLGSLSHSHRLQSPFLPTEFVMGPLGAGCWISEHEPASTAREGLRPGPGLTHFHCLRLSRSSCLKERKTVINARVNKSSLCTYPNVTFLNELMSCPPPCPHWKNATDSDLREYSVQFLEF